VDYAQYLSDISFRFIQPDQTPGGDGWFMAARGDGSAVKLLPLPGIPLDLYNCRLPADEAATRRALRDVCRIPRMSTFAIGALIQRGVGQLAPGQAFVNVGVWNGFTFLSGVAGNPDKICVGIDNFSQFGGPRDAFGERFRRLKGPGHQFHDGDYQEYFSRVHSGPIGFYIYDGEHSYANQLRGLEVAEPFLAEGGIIFVDDTNWIEPWQATMDFVARSPYEYGILLDRVTAGNAHPTFWNGAMVLRRGAKKTSRTAAAVSPSAARRREPPAGAPGQPRWESFIAPEQRGPSVPKVSVIVDGRAAGESLHAAIGDALALTYPNTEVIVTCGKAEAGRIGAYGERVVAVPLDQARGAGDFLAGLDASHGEFACFMGGTDRLPPHAVEIALNLSRDLPETMHAGGEWWEEVCSALAEITAVVPRGDTFILADENRFGLGREVLGRRVLPFVERDGQYWGPPPDPATAVRELGRLRAAGAGWIAFARHAFWWLEHYAELAAHLRSGHRTAAAGDRVVVFDLR